MLRSRCLLRKDKSTKRRDFPNDMHQGVFLFSKHVHVLHQMRNFSIRLSKIQVIAQFINLCMLSQYKLHYRRGGGGGLSTFPLYHGRGMTLRVRPRVNCCFFYDNFIIYLLFILFIYHCCISRIFGSQYTDVVIFFFSFLSKISACARAKRYPRGFIFYHSRSADFEEKIEGL